MTFFLPWILQILAETFGNNAVIGTGRNPDRASELREQGYHIIEGDLADEPFVHEDLQGFTHIVHCAALSSPFGPFERFFNNNVRATQHVLNGIASAEKIVHISTPSLYFNFSDRPGVRESDPLPPRFVNHYTTTKYLAEQAVLQHPRLRSVVAAAAQVQIATNR